ncbi:MAG: spore coat protein CotJB [Bacillaceae bacterium]|nr:spore coat protein CotJB [Bacillaceae bacterium]
MNAYKEKKSAKKSLLQRLQELEFALVELQLYLDTHPGDQRAVMQFNQLSRKMKQVMYMYESKYGPLLQYGHSLSPYKWVWPYTPWPWEIHY